MHYIEKHRCPPPVAGSTGASSSPLVAAVYVVLLIVENAIPYYSDDTFSFICNGYINTMQYAKCQAIPLYCTNIRDIYILRYNCSLIYANIPSIRDPQSTHTQKHLA